MASLQIAGAEGVIDMIERQGDNVRVRIDVGVNHYAVILQSIVISADDAAHIAVGQRVRLMLEPV